ncbi:MAG: hypothetical protein ACR2RL_08840, partial [Gammaproteobacteria bacterium]
VLGSVATGCAAQRERIPTDSMSIQVASAHVERTDSGGPPVPLNYVVLHVVPGPGFDKHFNDVLQLRADVVLSDGARLPTVGIVTSKAPDGYYDYWDPADPRVRRGTPEALYGFMFQNLVMDADPHPDISLIDSDYDRIEFFVSRRIAFLGSEPARSETLVVLREDFLELWRNGRPNDADPLVFRFPSAAGLN